MTPPRQDVEAALAWFETRESEVLGPNQTPGKVLAAALREAEAALDKLHGAKFSDRCYHALKSRAEQAEAANTSLFRRIAELEAELERSKNWVEIRVAAKTKRGEAGE